MSRPDPSRSGVQPTVVYANTEWNVISFVGEKDGTKVTVSPNLDLRATTIIGKWLADLHDEDFCPGDEWEAGELVGVLADAGYVIVANRTE